MSSLEISTGTSRIIPLCDLLSFGEKTLISVPRRFEHHLVFTLVQQSLLLNNSTIFPSLLVKVKSCSIPGTWVYSFRLCKTLDERIWWSIVPELYYVWSSGYLRYSVQVSFTLVGGFPKLWMHKRGLLVLNEVTDLFISSMSFFTSRLLDTHLIRSSTLSRHQPQNHLQASIFPRTFICFLDKPEHSSWNHIEHMSHNIANWPFRTSTSHFLQMLCDASSLPRQLRRTNLNSETQLTWNDNDYKAKKTYISCWNKTDFKRRITRSKVR